MLARACVRRVQSEDSMTTRFSAERAEQAVFGVRVTQNVGLRQALFFLLINLILR